MSGISPHNFKTPKLDSENYIKNAQDYLSIPRGVIYLDDVESLIDEGNIHKGAIRVLKKGLVKSSRKISLYQELDMCLSNVLKKLDELRR